MPLAVPWRAATIARVRPLLPRLSRSAPAPRVAAVSAAALVLASVFGTVAAVPASAAVPCSDGATPAQDSTLACTVAGTATLTVPAGTTSVDVSVLGAGGGAGYPARQHIGGNGAKVTGALALPTGTAYLHVVVGSGGTGDNHGTSRGGGASAVFAEDSSHGLLAKLVIAGGGGGGAYNGDGGSAGSAGTSDNAQAVSGPGQPGVGGTGGTGGTGNYAPGTAGQTNDSATLTVADGGAGGAVPGGATGGGGGGGYGGGGGGGGSRGSILSSNVAGGGGGSSLASEYLEDASIETATGTGGVQLPGLVASDGSTGSVTLTFHGLAVPAAPTGVVADAGDAEASVSFTAPGDGGSPITSYTVTASPGGRTSTCPGSPCVVSGLTNGTAYTFTVVAVNANGSSSASAASNTVTPALAPGAPTAVEGAGADGSALVSWTAPDSDGGSTITGYTVTASPGGRTATCVASPCNVTGLDNGTDYTFTVLATNAVGSSAPSAASAPVSVRTVPGAPSITKVTHGNGAATVTFDASSEDGGSAVTGYTVVASPGGATVACPGSPCTLGGLDNGQSYTLRVLATNAAGSSEPSSASDAITPATVPDAPSALEVDRGDREAALTFDAPDDDGGASVTGYEVSVDGGQSWKELETDGSGPYTATVTGLSNGTAYKIAVRAVNSEGTSAATSLSNVTPAGVPGTPSGVTVVRGDAQVGVSWTSPDDNGAAIDGYEVDVPELDKIVKCTASPCVIDGLTNGTAYRFRVRALNDVGRSGWSDLSDSVVPATTPEAPDLVDLYSGNGALVVRFTPVGTSDDGGDPVTGYEYTLDDDAWHTLPTGPWATGDDLVGSVDDLDNGTAVTLRVRAVNGLGGGTASRALTETPATVPSKPRSVEVSSSKGRTTVSWKEPTSDGGSPVTGYTVVAAPGGAQCAADGGSARSCTFTGLTSGATYEFSVTATNLADHRTGTGVSEAAGTGPVLVTDAPSAPAQLSVTPGDRTATLTFTVPSSNGGKAISGYEVSTDDGRTWHGVTTTAVRGSATQRTAFLGGLDNGRTYLVALRARNADGAGAATPASSTFLPQWFADSVSVGDRAAEIPVPAKPSSYRGALTHTVATNRSHDGTVAMEGASLQGRQLQSGQAVQLTAKLFGDSSTKLTSSGKKQLKSMARSLTYVDAISCEGYVNYGSPTKNLASFSKKRATAVCSALRGYAKQVDVETKVGYGDARPMVVGASYAKRVDNRRIVVVIDR